MVLRNILVRPWWMFVLLSIVLSACTQSGANTSIPERVNVDAATFPPATLESTSLTIATTVPTAVPVKPTIETPIVEQEATVAVVLPNTPVAPPITNEVWLNSDALTAQDLRGKVVLIDFWTFG